MELIKYKRNLSELSASLGASHVINILLSVALIISVAINLQSKESVLVLPPNMSEPVKLARNSADSGYKKSWAVYVASLAGNVQPNNAKFVAEAIGSMLAPDVHHKVASELGSQVYQIEKEGRRTRFTPRQVTYEEETDKVFVVGDFEIFLPGLNIDGSDEQRRTQLRKDKVFELIVEMDNGSPIVSHFSDYFGAPRNVAYIRRMEALKAKGASAQ